MPAFAKIISTFKKVLFAVTAVTLTACSGGGGGGSNNPPADPPVGFTGTATDGPVANATVKLYNVTYGMPVAVGSQIGSDGSTDLQAKIQGINVPDPLPSAPYTYIIEFSSNAATRDLSTCNGSTNYSDSASVQANCLAPVISTMRTIITDETIASGQNIYATPLTTIATDIAMTNGGVDAAAFKTALEAAANQVTSMLGFGMSSDVDIFNTPPVVDDNTNTPEEKSAIAQYRTAISAVAAIVHEMEKSSVGDADTVLSEITADMKDGDLDGTVDGSASTVFTANTLAVLDKDPSTLIIPGTSTTVADVETQLEAETAIIGSTQTFDSTDTNITTDPEPAEVSDDVDGDTVINSLDAFPNNPAETTDTDGDGIGNNADPDDDNDGWVDTQDDYPTDATQYLDPALDRDSDGVINNADNCVFASNTDQADADADGVGDVCDGITDTDNDGIEDASDNCPTVINPDQTNTGGSAAGDACDPDIDGDGTANGSDAFPYDASETSDNDGDSIGDVADLDDDNDGVPDLSETPGCELLADCDSDGYFDNVDSDDTNPSINVNFDPVANNDTGTVAEGGSVNIAVKANDTDANSGDTLTVSAGTATNGTVTVEADGTVTYAHNGSETTTDSFTYTINDGTVDSNTATVTITITPQNDAPVAVDDAAGVNEGASVNFDVRTNDSDAEGDALTVTAGTATNGTVTVEADGTVTYQHNGGETTSDSFTYTVNDGTIDSNTATVTITVTPVNDAPVAVDDAAGVNEGASVNFDVRTNDSDAEGATLTVTPGTASNGTVTVEADGTLTYAHDGSETTTDSFTYTVNDGSGAANATSNTATVTITITPQNDAPVAVDDAAGVNEGASVNFDVRTNDSDAEGATLTVTPGTASNGAVTVEADGTLTYAHDGSETTSDSFTYTVSDGTTSSNMATVNITINPQNDAPVASDDAASVQPGNTVTIDVVANDTDAEGTALLVSSIGTVSGGTGTATNNGNGTITYDASADSNGATVTFTYVATDGTDTSNTATVTVNVVANASPVITQGASVSVTMDEDGVPTAFVAPAIDATDADGDSLTWDLAAQATNGTATVSGTGASPTITYAPDSNYNGSDSFDVRVDDGISTPATITVNVTLNPINDNPVAVDDSAGTAIGTTINIDVLANDNDTIDSDTLSVASVGSATGGSVTNNTTDVSYTAPATAGTYTFSYTISDGNGGSATATVTVDVYDPIDATGVWRIDAVVTNTVDQAGGSGCDVVPTDTEVEVMSVTQTGTAIVSINTIGATLTGTIDESTGVFSMTTGVGTPFVETAPDINAPTDPTATESWEEDITASGTVSSNGTLTGTLQINRSWNGTPQCDVTHSMTGTFVYKHTGTEDYSGVYAIELAGEEGSNEGSGPFFDQWREGLPIELRFTDGGTPEVQIGLPDEGETLTPYNQVFDPNTGFFSISVNETQVAGDSSWSEDKDFTLSGILMLDPAVTNGTNGNPMVVVDITEGGYGYNCDFNDTVGCPLPNRVEQGYSFGYGKKLDTVGHTRTSLIEQGNGTTRTDILVGLQNAPLINTGGDLWLQVRNTGDTADLCTIRYFDSSEGAGDGRYFEQTNMPHPDMDVIAFRGNTYSSLNCDASNGGTNTINFNDVLPVNIIDDGGDGLGGAADTVVYSTTVTATPVVNGADQYTEGHNVSDININGTKASATQLGGTVQVSGYFDYSEDIVVNFPAHVEGADKYQIRVQWPNDFIKYRYNTTGTSVTIPADTLEEDQSLRLVAMKDDSNSARAMSFSRRALIKPGANGYFNVELGSAIDFAYQTFQIHLESDPYSNAITTGLVTNNPNISFVSGTYDTVTDTVSLTLQDVSGFFVGVGVNFTATLTFTDSRNATVTGSDGIANGAARAVSPELAIRSYNLSNGTQQTFATMANVVDPSFYTHAIFKKFDNTNIFLGGADTGTTTQSMWHETNAGDLFDDNVTGFMALPTDDGNAQFNGFYVNKRSNTDWGLGGGLLDAADYKVVMKDGAAGTNSLVFKNTYASNDPSTYTAPTLSQVTVVRPTAGDVFCANGSTCNSANPITLSGADLTSWSLKWVGTLPAGAYWRIIISDVATGEQVRTDFMDATHPDLTDNLDGTFTWSSAGEQLYPDAGQQLEVQVRISNTNGWKATEVGTQVGGHRAHVTQ